MKNTPKKSFKKSIKIKEPELTYEAFLHSLKKDHFYENDNLLEKFLISIERKKRINLILDYLETTHFKAFQLGMKTFKRAIDKFYLTKDEEDLIQYKRNLTDDGTAQYNNFNFVREMIVLDILDMGSPYSSAREILYSQCYAEIELVDSTMDFPEMYNKLAKEFFIFAAPYKWPEAKNLKVLFG